MTKFVIQRKVGFDFLKLFYAILIFLLHYFAFCPNPFGTRILTSFYICCEGFFIISGIFLMEQAKKTQQNSIIFVVKKWLGLLPFLLIGAILFFISSLIDSVIHNTINNDWPNIVLQTFFFIVPISIYKSNFVIWFISTLLIGYLIYLPFAKKFQKVFPYFALLISISIYTCIYCLSPTIDIWSDKLIKILPYAYLRALAGLGIGCFINKTCSIHCFVAKKNFLNLLADLLICIMLGLFIFLSIWKPRTRFEIILLVIITFVTWILNNKIGFINQKKWLWTKWIATFSTIFYLTHTSWITIFNNFNLSPIPYLAALLITTVFVSIIFIPLIEIIKRLFSIIGTKWNQSIK